MNRQDNDMETGEIKHTVSQSELIEPLGLCRLLNSFIETIQLSYFRDKNRYVVGNSQAGRRLNTFRGFNSAGEVGTNCTHDNRPSLADLQKLGHH